MLKQRIITALILAPLALYAILFLPIFWFEIAIAGKYEAIADTVSDKINIIKIEKKLISLGSFSKK